MPLRNYSLRVEGAGDRTDEYRAALREVCAKAGSPYFTIRPDAGDLLVNAVFDVPDEATSSRTTGRWARKAAKVLPKDLRGRVVATQARDEPHELSAQLAEDVHDGATALAGATQTREDIEAWEEFLAGARPRGVLELGTASGAFATWLAERVEWLRTVDVQAPSAEPPGFVRLDIWAQADEVRELIAAAPRPFVLYCDNGSKPLEVETFAPALRTGDFLAVHDLGTEVFARDIPAEFAARLVRGLTGFYERRP